MGGGKDSSLDFCRRIVWRWSFCNPALSRPTRTKSLLFWSKNLAAKAPGFPLVWPFLALGAVGLLGYGISQGNWTDFVQQWRTDRFIHVMTLDFCLLCLLFPALLGDDLARRGIKDSRIFWAVSLIPLLGAVTYLALRPPLKESFESVNKASGHGNGEKASLVEVKASKEE